MASLTNAIIVLQSVATSLYRYVSPIVIFLGTIGCLLNLIVFIQRILRKNSCSIYFIAYNLSNLIYIYSSILILALSIGYNIDLSISSSITCHICLYSSVLFNFLSVSYLILASLDRIFITSSNVVTRRRSTLRLAYICIISITLFWMLFHIHILILANIIEIAPGLFICSLPPGVYFIYVNYTLLIKEVAGLVLIILCGLWSLKNIRNAYRVRVAPRSSQGRTHGTSRRAPTSARDRQLMFMLLVDIGIYVIFNSAFVISIIYEQITEKYDKSFEQIQIETNVRKICIFSIGIPFCTSFYTSLYVSKTFRSEVKRVFGRIRRRCMH